MILGFPGSGSFLQDVALAAKLNFALSQLGEKRTPASLTDEFVDIGNDVNRQNDVGSLTQIFPHTNSVT